TSTMRVAEILSDLTSLRVCEPSAALALVSARPPPPSSSFTTSTNLTTATSTQRTDEADADPDLTRAKDLVELHYAVKVAHARGELGGQLAEARDGVRRAVG
ncbi:hypothetical protein K402DRAFT_302897, partial [Aulographum hederae CBS 113979]